VTADPPSPADRSLQVVVFDYRPLVAEGIASLLREVEAMRIQAVVTSRSQFAASLQAAHPDVIVVGIGEDCTEQTQALLEVTANASYRVVGVIGGTDIDSISELLTTGVSSVVSATASRGELQRAVLEALSGSTVMAPGEMAAVIIHLRSSAATENPDLPSLSPRETEVLRALVEGWSTARIAQTLGISTNTVRTHIQNLLGKLGVHSKLEATAIALRHGLIARSGMSSAAESSNVSSFPRRDAH
jgi:DNA-binding NarL/FixJ family response regulator